MDKESAALGEFLCGGGSGKAIWQFDNGFATTRKVICP